MIIPNMVINREDHYCSVDQTNIDALNYPPPENLCAKQGIQKSNFVEFLIVNKLKWFMFFIENRV